VTQLELRHLRYFLAVPEELNFSRAAERLHIAQPALSAQIRSLETQLGAELFSRTTRKVDLTPAGELLLADAREIVERAAAKVVAAARATAARCGSPSRRTARERRVPRSSAASPRIIRPSRSSSSSLRPSRRPLTRVEPASVALVWHRDTQNAAVASFVEVARKLAAIQKPTR
jgi:DNA-binding transcriptional LysR family regulator